MKSIDIYTDGSTRGNGTDGAPGAWAFAIVVGDEMINSCCGFEANTTNQRCELLAAINALKFSAAAEERTIYSDSAYLCNCIAQHWYVKWQKNGWLNAKKQPVANQDLWEQLIPYFEDNSIHFVKVQGHATNKWNNYVDNLAQTKSLEGK